MTVNGFQDSKVLTSNAWRHSHMQFSGRSINNYMRGPIQLSTPLNSQLTFRI